ncbi:Sulfur carrier protein ThiS [hydrothermal vent metagenome]|uniref:Sulfur carrier protein ThiS n=1 Tax=hydrothermal vent metagenome TaxID=652676 RepID=A0A1W1DYW0_9ZZZZ
MKLILNGKSLEVADNLTARNLIVQLGYENQRIALEVNEAIIAKSKHTEFTLNAGDKVEIIKAVGGG